MNLHKAAMFVIGAAAAAAVWTLVWPAGNSVSTKIPVVAPRGERQPAPTPEEIAGWLRDLESAQHAAARAKAAERFGDLPASAFPAALENVTLVRDWRVTLPAKVLLSRWAALDGEAAVNWAWLNARSSGRWGHAFREIVPSWAWHRPQELAEWSRLQVEALRSNPVPMTMSLAEIEESDLPLLERSDFQMIGHALSKAKPRLGFEILLLSGSIDSGSSILADSLHSVAEVRDALSAFDCLEAMEPSSLAGYDQIVANALLRRWKYLDPGDFAKSPHARLVPDQFPQPDIPELKPVVRDHQEWDAQFQQWRNSTPHTRPDMSGWSAAKREAWEDFEALMPAAAESR